MKITKLKTIHPILFAIFPVISLYTHNIDKIPVSSITIPLIISLIFSLCILFILKIVWKNNKKAAINTSLFLILFFSYGHMVSFIENLLGVSLTISERMLLLIGTALIFVLGTIMIARINLRLHAVSDFFTVVGIAILVIPIIQITTYKLSTRFQTPILSKITSTNIKTSSKAQNQPDIYYIILDGHARTDILQHIYSYSNDAFIKKLESIGFYIADKSTSNYSQTYLSLASSLNLTYVNFLADVVGTASRNRELIKKLINDNKVSKFLKKQGYFYVVFSSSWSGIQNTANVDLYVQPTISLSEFAQVLINTTPLPYILRQDQYTQHQNIILYELKNISSIADAKDPTFAFIHIMAPHPPFVFDQNGNSIKQNVPFEINDPTWKQRYGRTSNDYIKYYRDQLVYIDKLVFNCANDIINRSQNPPIIIIQSDHGPAGIFESYKPSNTGLKERFSILNAYYLPSKKANNLYKSITPINTFRVIFNQYFNTDYKLLPDENYFSPWDRPYSFTNVTQIVQSAINPDSPQSNPH